jgi:transcription termination factor NusB
MDEDDTFKMLCGLTHKEADKLASEMMTRLFNGTLLNNYEIQILIDKELEKYGWSTRKLYFAING